MNSAQGTLNHWRAEAAKLPVPSQSAEWTDSPGGVRFDCVEINDESGIYLAWQPRQTSGQTIAFRWQKIA